MAETTATHRRASQGIVAGKGDAHVPRALVSTVELAASSTGDTVFFGNIPSTARVLGSSKIYTDDLATTGSPTLDLGIGEVDGNFGSTSDDPDALSDGHDVTSAVAGADVVGNIANIGLPVWDLVNGLTTDPGGLVKVYGTVADAATTQTGTVTLEMYYLVD